MNLVLNVLVMILILTFPRLFSSALIISLVCVEFSPIVIKMTSSIDLLYIAGLFRIGSAGVVAKCMAIFASKNEWLSSIIIPLSCS